MPNADYTIRGDTSLDTRGFDAGAAAMCKQGEQLVKSTAQAAEAAVSATQSAISTSSLAIEQALTQTPENVSAQAKKSYAQMQSDIMILANTYKKQGLSMSDALTRAHREIDKSQYETAKTAKSASREYAESWASAGNEMSQNTSKTSALVTLGLNAISVAAGDLLSKLSQEVVQLVKTVVYTGLAFNAQMENYTLAFENLLGSAESANAALDAIKQDAASTPFDVAGLVAANRLLLSTGISANEARLTISALGNAVSASGGGNVELQRMASNLQQIANVGKATTIDIRQFAYAGIDIYGILADYTGLAKNQVQELTISYDLLVAALKAASAEGGRYAGAMDAYSRTLEGRQDTLIDNATQLAGALTEGLFEAQNQLVSAAAGWVDTLSETLLEEGPVEMVAAGVELVAEIIEGIVTGLPQLISAAAQLVADFCSSLIQRLPAIASTGGQMIGGLIAGLLGMVASLGSAVGQIVAKIIEFFLSGDFLLVGIEIIEGVIQGFMDALPTLIDTVVSAVTGLADSAKKAIQGIFDVPIPEDELPYHQGSEKDDDYWRQVGQHYTDTGQDQKNGNYDAAAESVFDLDEYLKSLGETEQKTAEKTETLADKLSKASKALSGSQSAYKTLSAAVDEYNETGKISIATWQDVMDLAPEYQALLVREGDTLRINEEAYASLSAAQRLEIETLAAQNGATAETIALLDEMLAGTENGAQRLKAAQEELENTWSNGYLTRLKNLVSDLLAGRFGDALLDGLELAWKKLDTETQQQLVDLAQGWLDTLEAAFIQDGFAGLAEAGKSIAEGLAAGLQDTSSGTGALLDSILAQVGISGGVEGLVSVLAEIGPVVLGVAAAAAAVAVGVIGVGAAFSYTVEQSRVLQSQIQELTQNGQELSEELQSALDILQPSLEQASEMLTALDQAAALLSNTVSGLGIELTEMMAPIIRELLDTILPVLESMQPALEAVGDLLGTLLGLFGTLINSVLVALQPVLEAVGPLLETFALLLNTVATILSNLLSPALRALGEVLNWLLQPVLWVADAINAAIRFVVDLINTLLRFLGLKTIELPDGSAGLKGEAFDEITSALDENTEALKEQNDLIRNPPTYKDAGLGPSTGALDYSAALAAARSELLRQNVQAATNYSTSGGRVNGTLTREIVVPITLDGKEIARATAPYIDEELAF